MPEIWELKDTIPLLSKYPSLASVYTYIWLSTAQWAGGQEDHLFC